MGYAILGQWTPTPPIPKANISDLVLSRVLEHYNITHPLRSTIQFRTFRATFPSSDWSQMSTGSFPSTSSAAAPTRILTTVTYSQPIPPVRDVPVPQGARDDVTYLFLEDRGAVLPAGAVAAGGDVAAVAAGGTAGTDGATAASEEEKKDTEDEGFEIIEAMDVDKPAAAEPPAQPQAQPQPQPPAPAAPQIPPPSRKYKILAVKPATLVMPMLHNLLSPFVLGLTKSARAAANLTAQADKPKPLPGMSLNLSTFAFPPTAHPQPALSLSVHILPNAGAQTIFLEGEWEGAPPSEDVRETLKEFLRGCVPENVGGDIKFLQWEEGEKGEEEDLDGWKGVEKSRRVTYLLARALRESSFI